VRFESSAGPSSVGVTRQQFEDRTADLLERTVYTTRQVVSQAGIAWSEVSRILLVGGSTRMPMVSARLEAISGIRPDRLVNPDEAVARGAALYANYLLNQRLGRPTAFSVTNVNSHSLGIEGIDPQTLRKTNVILIPRNTPLPAMFTERFTTKRDGQQSLVVQVLEGETSDPEDCTRIGGTVIRGLPAGLPRGTPVEVTFEYGTNGRLEVRTSVPGAEDEAVLTIERNSGLSDERIAGWRNFIADSAPLPPPG